MVFKINKNSNRKSKVSPTEAGKEKNFWKTFKLLFSFTSTVADKTALVENEVIITDDKDVAEYLNSHFASIAKTLSITSAVMQDYSRSPNPVVDEINKYASHQSIKKIKDVYGTFEQLEFSKVDAAEVFSKIYRLDKPKKVNGDIHVDVLKLAANHCYKEITHLINHGIQSSMFQSNLKLADLSPCSKAGNSASKKSFRPISKPSCLSKIYERLMYTQTLSFMKDKL